MNMQVSERNRVFSSKIHKKYLILGNKKIRYLWLGIGKKMGLAVRVFLRPAHWRNEGFSDLFFVY